MKKLILFGLAGFAILFTLGSLGPSSDTKFSFTAPWNLPGVHGAYFTFEDGILSTQTDVQPLFADVLLADADLEPLQATVEKLLTEGITITMEGKAYPFPAQMKDLVIEKKEEGTRISLAPDFLDYIVKILSDAAYIPSTDIHLTTADETKVSKVTMEGATSEGNELITDLTIDMIDAALNKGETSANALTRAVDGRIINESGKDLGPLMYLAEGRSSFWGSSPEREFNIRKAMNERFNGILIPPGAEFSYVDFLGPIEYGGWKQAFTIFKGTQLEKAPAGGVCQVSTTMYRAVLATALQVTEQRSHSLYVIYYQHFGDGLDATIFPGEQDFKFVNNTPNYLLMTAQIEGYKEAIIRFYGEDDGRSTQLYGPYTTSNQTEEMKTGVGSSLGIGQIVWKYLITWGDGSVEEKWLLSDYMSAAQQNKEPVVEPL